MASKLELSTERDSYFRRHWRGELSLPRSYWINGVLIFGVGCNLMLALTVTFTIMLFRQQDDIGAPIVLLLIALELAAYVWALVGTWRSAGRYRGSRVWPILARIAMCLGVLITIGNVGKALSAMEQFQSD